jgi:hypothetical protein
LQLVFNYIGGTFTAGVLDTSGKFATGVVENQQQFLAVAG